MEKEKLMKIALCSVPKSGTYLISNFLIELGFINSKIHLNDNEYSDYNKASTVNEARKTPEKFKVESDFYNTINKIKENQFAVGHFSTFNKKHLSDFKTIFIYRDLKKCCASFAFWTAKTTRWINFENNSDWRKSIGNKTFVSEFLEEHGKSLFSLFNKTVPWIDEQGILKVKFENLIGENGRETQISEYERIIEYLSIKISKLELESKISNTLNKESLTKVSSNVDYDFYLNKVFMKNFNYLGLNKLNKKLGYDKFEDKFLELKNKIFNSKNLSFYDKYWILNKKNKNSWSYGITIVDNLIDNYEFKTVLDAGCGSGDVVRYLLSKGYIAKGIELSESVLRDYAQDLLNKGIVSQGSLKKIPYEDNTFDVIFSSEVLEHIPEEDISDVVNELYRVSKNYVFLTISLRPSSNFNKYHITLKDRNWWENKFFLAGFIKDNAVVEKLQSIKLGASNKEILEIGPTKSHIHEMDWFIENPPLSFDGELEPWYFIFKKNEK
ncbi:hypothetical protein PW52_09450 [Tamlana sedimentorum]|uniref:Methyltransferase type 11 domain-containing protein n=1 Tax=Neotamlana sedimentorum TaxID=1435349 RepID=A0A0D7WA10_9FLAO|nr:class I SAM-dependent methyltransferase [Tamlana sedimentorum]KJD35934.1 hypothetical protein PW52_09450 [Tamlana sedimentorum]